MGLQNQSTTTFRTNGASNFLAAQTPTATIGIGLDSCVIPLRHSGLNLIQTTDFFIH